jgi:hypothetical protein
MTRNIGQGSSRRGERLGKRMVQELASLLAPQQAYSTRLTSGRICGHGSTLDARKGVWVETAGVVVG